MVIQLVTKQGKALYLRVPTAEGLVQRGADGSVREDAYIVKRVSRDSARLHVVSCGKQHRHWGIAGANGLAGRCLSLDMRR